MIRDRLAPQDPSNINEDPIDRLSIDPTFLSEDSDRFPQVQRIATQLNQLSPEEFTLYQPIAERFAVEGNLYLLEESLGIYTQSRDYVRTLIENPEIEIEDFPIEQLLSLESEEEESEPQGFFRRGLQFFKDLLDSILQSPRYAPEILGELWELVEEHWPMMAGIAVAIIAAEMGVGLLVGIPEPTGLSKALAVFLQIFLFTVLGVSFFISITQGVIELTSWLETAAEANGDPEKIAKASRHFLWLIFYTLTALLSNQAIKKQLAPEKLRALQAMLQRSGPSHPRLPEHYAGVTLNTYRHPNDPNHVLVRVESSSPSNRLLFDPRQPFNPSRHPGSGGPPSSGSGGSPSSGSGGSGGPLWNPGGSLWNPGGSSPDGRPFFPPIVSSGGGGIQPTQPGSSSPPGSSLGDIVGSQPGTRPTEQPPIVGPQPQPLPELQPGTRPTEQPPIVGPQPGTRPTEQPPIVGPQPQPLPELQTNPRPFADPPPERQPLNVAPAPTPTTETDSDTSTTETETDSDTSTTETETDSDTSTTETETDSASIDFEPLTKLVSEVLGISIASEAEIQAIANGEVLNDEQIGQLVRHAGSWKNVLNNYVMYRGLMQQIIDYRTQAVAETANSILDNSQLINDPDLLDKIQILLTEDSKLSLHSLVSLVAAGSTEFTSDYDITASAPAGFEALEIYVVELFNELFRQQWGLESGTVFDTNVYTSGHMRPEAFFGDGRKLYLVNRIVRLLDEIGNREPGIEERQQINSIVSEIDGLRNVQNDTRLPLLEESNFDEFSRQVRPLQGELEKAVRQQYLDSKQRYGAGPEFDELSYVMSLVHMREFLNEANPGETASTDWTYVEERMTRNEVPEMLREQNRAQLYRAGQIHDELREERTRKISELRRERPNDTDENLRLMANNLLYVEYLRKVRDKLAEIRREEKAGASLEQIQRSRFELQELQSRALFFANEAYMTAIAAEQVVLNQQMRLNVRLPTPQYLASINEQMAFIGEQIAHYENNFGRALWKTSKYVDRIIFAIKTIQEQTEGQALSEVIERVERLKPLVQRLLYEVKKSKDEKLQTDEAKDEEAESIARENSDILGSNASEWRRILLDLQIDVNLEAGEYFINNPNSD
ncbi:hypothetical protein [Baaleninema simplex]|uniref:hypothetical protein n=1 Tax=Baaleninema simplex TaxID=2862350 RepID=UPI0011818177|nr:hypothetical protein [Baaleninema simplex]